MKLKFTGIASLIAIVCFISCTKEDHDAGSKSSAMGPDPYYVNQAAYFNYAEMTLGELTLNSKGNDLRVRAFAGAMALEHSNMQKSLRDSVPIELVPVSTDSAHIRIIRNLQTLSGYSYDSAYLKNEIREHDAAMAIYQAPINFVPVSAPLRNYFIDNLPRLLLHRKIADSLLHQITK
jgi:putative membrane protein